jgi:hypothetical protein
MFGSNIREIAYAWAVSHDDIPSEYYFTDSPSPIVSEEGAIESQEVTAIEAANKNIDTAKALQQKMNLQNQEINSALGE